jgi:uncharacterized protein (TIRG00374 family)
MRRVPVEVRGGLRVKVIAVLVLTLICLGFVLWGLDLSLVFEHLVAVEFVWVLPLLVLYTLNMVARTRRFILLLGRGVHMGPAFSVVSVSFLATNVIPLRMGELVKPYLFAEKHGIPFGVGVAALVMERVLDVVALLVFVMWVGVMVDLPGTGIVVGGVDLLFVGQRTLGTVAVTMALVGVIMAVFGEALVGRATVAILPISAKWSRRVEELGMSFSGGFQLLLERPRDVLESIFWTAFIWVTSVISFVSVLYGFGVDPLNLDLVITNFTGTLLGITVLPTPGYVGGFEAGCVASLLLFEVSKDLAGAYAILLHGLMFLHTVVLGVACLALEGWSLRKLVTASRQASG